MGLGWSLKKIGNVLYFVYFIKYEKILLNLLLYFLLICIYDFSIFCFIEKIGEDIYISIVEFFYIYYVFIYKINSIF